MNQTPKPANQNPVDQKPVDLKQPARQNSVLKQIILPVALLVVGAVLAVGFISILRMATGDQFETQEAAKDQIKNENLEKEIIGIFLEFVYNEGPGTGSHEDLWLYNFSTGEQERLTYTSGIGIQAFSNGRKVLFRKGGILELYDLEKDSSPVVLTNDAIENPTFSFDGNDVLYFIEQLGEDRKVSLHRYSISSGETTTLVEEWPSVYGLFKVIGSTTSKDSVYVVNNLSGLHEVKNGEITLLAGDDEEGREVRDAKLSKDASEILITRMRSCVKYDIYDDCSIPYFALFDLEKMQETDIDTTQFLGSIVDFVSENKTYTKLIDVDSKSLYEVDLNTYRAVELHKTEKENKIIAPYSDDFHFLIRKEEIINNALVMGDRKVRNTFFFEPSMQDTHLITTEGNNELYFIGWLKDW